MQGAREGDTSHTSELMLELLKQHPGQRLPLAEAVCSHESFGQTVENVFALSFLVGHVFTALLSVLVFAVVW